ncbi:MAG: tetratricopeptide repeat protein [Caulobacteraceae bacterium]|nr:tetratricopeptide repeat protein [Caulobacteraceae bacterium]
MAPPDPDAANLGAALSRGLALYRSGRLAEARACYEAVLRGDPEHFEALHRLAMIDIVTGRPEPGVALLRRAIAVNPTLASVHGLLASTLDQLDRPYEALVSYDKAIALEPSLAKAHLHRGLVLRRLGRLESALASFERAIALGMDTPAVLLERGSAQSMLGRPAEALADYDKVVALDRDNAMAHYDRGIALHALGRPNAAVASFTTAIDLKPDYAEALINRSHSLLLGGRFDEGWREHEHRKRLWGAAARRFDAERPWFGQFPLSEETLFIHAEQGLGDTIQFSRYAKLASDRPGRTILAVQTPLKSLLRQLGPSLEVIGDGEPWPDFDCQCSLMSLPLAFGTTERTIPASERYLRAAPERRARFEGLLGPGTRRRVGLAWSGSADHANDRNRSIAFDALAPMLSEAFDWIAL